MSCSICEENPPNYHLNGCCHSICCECAHHMGEHAEHFKPFGDEIATLIPLPRLTCPFCRAKEVMTKEDCNVLYESYPNAYRVWFQLELFRDEWGTMYYTSMRKNNFRLIPYEDVDPLLERIPFTSRTTSCYVGYHNLYTDPYYFIQPPFPMRDEKLNRSACIPYY